MGQSILIAEPREILRAGLRTIFDGDPLISCIDEAASAEEMRRKMASCSPDVLIVHQSFITDLTQLPAARFVILASKPSKDMLLAASASGALAYLLEDAPADLLRMVVRLTEGEFLLDPSLTTWLLECISGDILPSESNKILTTREQEIFRLLLEDGLSNRAISERLCISEATVKTHLVHIFRKLKIKRRPTRVLQLTMGEYGMQHTSPFLKSRSTAMALPVKG